MPCAFDAPILLRLSLEVFSSREHRQRLTPSLWAAYALIHFI